MQNDNTDREWTADDQAAYEAEAAAYFAALDYACERYATSTPAQPLPVARTVRRSWWRRLLGGFR